MKMKIQDRESSSTRRAPLTQDQRDALLTLYKHRIPAEEIAKFFDLAPAAIYYHFRAFKLLNVEQVETKSIQDILLMEGYE